MVILVWAPSSATTSSFWLPHGLPGESPASFCPSWGSPQLHFGLPGGVPNFSLNFLGESPASPGPSQGAHSHAALLGNPIPGSHTMCCQLWLLRPCYTCWIQGPGLSNLISSFVPTFWVPW